MKSFILAMTFCILTIAVSSQEFIASEVYLSKLRADSMKYSAKGIGVIQMSEQTSEFNVGVPLYPIVTSPNENDSINRLNKLFFMNFKAVFPVNPLTLDNIERDKKTYSMIGEISINGVTRPLKINVDVYRPVTQDKKTDSRDAQSVYPVHINFVIEINPAEFNMDNETIKFTQAIVIEVEYGIINRTEN